MQAIKTFIWEKGYALLFYVHIYLGTVSKPNRRLIGGSVQFRPVSTVLNNDNRTEPDGTASQPAVGFWSAPYSFH